MASKSVDLLIKEMIKIGSIDLTRPQSIMLSCMYGYPSVLQLFCNEMQKVIGGISSDILISIPLSSGVFIAPIAMALKKPFVEPVVVGRMYRHKGAVLGQHTRGQKAVIVDGVLLEGQEFKNSFIVAESVGMMITHAIVFTHPQDKSFSGIEQFLKEKKVPIVEVASMLKITNIWNNCEKVSDQRLAA